MSGKSKLKEAFDIEAEYGAIYTGGLVKWISDGQKFLCQNNARISVVSVPENKVERTIGDDTSGNTEQTTDDIIYTFALSDDDEFLCTVHKSSLLKLWHVTNGQLIRMWKSSHQGPVPTLAFSPNSIIIASGGTDSTVRLWDYQRRTCLGSLRGTHGVISVLEFNPQASKRLVYAAGDDHTIRGWHWETRDLIATLTGHLSKVTSLSFSDDGKYLVSSSRDKVLIMWDLEQQTQVRVVPTYESIENKHTKAVGCVAFGKIAHTSFASVSQDTCLKLWNVPKTFEKDTVLSLNCVSTQIAHKDDINCVTISPNDKLIATASQDKTAKLWTANNLTLLGVLRGHRRGIWCARFSPIDQILMTTSGDCVIKLWSLTDMACVVSLEGHDSSVMRAEFIGHGMQILSAGSDGLIKLWNIKSSDCATTLDKHDDRIWTMVVAQDETHFFSGGADSLLLKWKDVTDEQKQAKQKELQEAALEEQELSNLLKEKKLLKALRLALRLGKPNLSMKIVTQLIKNQEEGLEATIHRLGNDDKETLLNHVTVWNTNSRNSRVAQLVLNILIKEVISGKFTPSQMNKLVEEVLPYTDRHFKRMTDYLIDLKFVEHTLTCMQPYATVDVEMADVAQLE